MNTSRLIICGAECVGNYRSSDVTHILTIANPGTQVSKPNWFSGEHLVLYFGDVVSVADAFQCKTKEPTIDDVRRAVTFVTNAWQIETAKILIHCDYGASRSPAIAYVALANILGLGLEEETLQRVIEIRPDSVPNILVVKLGDLVLDRHGDLLTPLNKLYAALNAEITLLLPPSTHEELNSNTQ